MAASGNFFIGETLFAIVVHGRREPQKDKPPAQITSCKRHYLTMVKTQKHREALTSVLLSAHLLAVEVSRYVDHRYQPVPRSDRLCRFCKAEVETPEHTLIRCNSLESLVNLRGETLLRLAKFTTPDGRTFKHGVLKVYLDPQLHSLPSIPLISLRYSTPFPFIV
jgi:hypothetical protein